MGGKANFPTKKKKNVSVVGRFANSWMCVYMVFF
jgi:hypothetical protein